MTYRYTGTKNIGKPKLRSGLLVAVVNACIGFSFDVNGIIWVLSYFASTLIFTSWDTRKDWGLFPSRRTFLRSTANMYPSYYYKVIFAVNTMLRLTWAFNIIPDPFEGKPIHQEIFVFCIAFAELLRRTLLS